MADADEAGRAQRHQVMVGGALGQARLMHHIGEAAIFHGEVVQDAQATLVGPSPGYEDGYRAQASGGTWLQVAEELVQAVYLEHTVRQPFDCRRIHTGQPRL